MSLFQATDVVPEVVFIKYCVQGSRALMSIQNE